MVAGLVQAQQVKQTRNVGAFTGIEVSGAFKVFLRMGTESSLTVIADKEALTDIKSRVNNGILVVDVDSDWWDSGNKGKMELYITVTTLKEIDLSGACSLETKNTIKATTLEIDLSGACKMEADFSCDVMELDLSGATKLTLAGNCTKFNVEASGASAIYASDLQAKYVNIDASGACKAEVSATTELNIDASGACKVYYKGNAKVNSDVSGAASVSKM